MFFSLQGTKKRKKGPDAPAVVIPSSQTQTTQPPAPAFAPTTKLQALSVITLAKMCLQHEDMAKKIVPAFGRLLDTAGDVAIKNNVMFALTDMCRRYASLVDPLLPQMTACLRDDNLTVRRWVFNSLNYKQMYKYLPLPGPR